MTSMIDTPSSIAVEEVVGHEPGIRARVARRVVESMARRVPVDLRLPDGSLLGQGPSIRQAPAHPGAGARTPADQTPHRETPARPTIEIVRPDALFDRISREPKIGIAEGYMAGDWRPEAGTDLTDALLPFAERLTALVPPGLGRLRRLVDRRIPAAQRNSVSGSRRNIAAHYDLSNELFATFLDESLTYSAALFDDATPWSSQTLEDAQLRKVHAILDLAGVRAGSRVLEIGTGWGTLAIEAARRGARVTTITLSREQAQLAHARVAAAGCADAVDIRVQDYREVEGTYDAVVSVEMVEAVGEEFWPTYFGVLDRRLAPGGVAAIQSILMSHERYRASRHSYGWIQKHIFPGGLIPSVQAIEDTTTRHTDLRVGQVRSFGPHYAETLRRWRSTFDARWPEIAGLGFDETFRRMWELYLAYSEAGFASGQLDVAQIRLERAGGGAA